MFLRTKFVTNSSSTCFIAYGVEVWVDDQGKFSELAQMEGIDGVSVATSWLDENYATFYWSESELPADEYNFWQSIEHPHLDDLVKREADENFKQLAEQYGCHIIRGPFWGFYNSGH